MRRSLQSWKGWLLLLLLSAIGVSALIFAYFPSLIIHKLEDHELQARGLQTKEIWVAGDRLHYAEGGQGKQTLLFVHGFSSSMNDWVSYIPAFMSDFHVIALDLPGHGCSQAPVDQKYDMISLGKVLAGFIEAKGLQSIDIIGSSMGGGIALAYAGEHPERVAHLAVINPLAVHPPKLSEVHEALGRGENLLIPHDAASFLRMQEVVYNAELTLHPILSKLLVNYFVEVRQHNHAIFEQLIAGGGLEEQLPKIQVPVLLVQSDADRVIDPSSAELISTLMPHVTIQMIAGGAHTLRGTSREEAIVAIKKFFGRSCAAETTPEL